MRLVLDPLELTSTTYWPWEVMTERFVVGHVEEGGEVRVARPWPVGRSAHPAGGLTSTTGDLLRDTRLHLDPPPALAPMQEAQADAAEEGERVGLTWYGDDRLGTIRHAAARWASCRRPRAAAAQRLRARRAHQPLPPNGLRVIDAALEHRASRGPTRPNCTMHRSTSTPAPTRPSWAA